MKKKEEDLVCPRCKQTTSIIAKDDRYCPRCKKGLKEIRAEIAAEKEASD